MKFNPLIYWTLILSMLMERGGEGEDKAQDRGLCVGCKYVCYTDHAVRLDTSHGLGFTIQKGSKCCRAQKFAVHVTFKIFIARQQT